MQDNVFVQLLCSIQYRVVKESADDAFYELQNPKEQIQAYVFDGWWLNSFLINKFSYVILLSDGSYSSCLTVFLLFQWYELLFLE